MKVMATRLLAVKLVTLEKKLPQEMSNISINICDLKNDMHSGAPSGRACKGRPSLP